MKKSPRTGFGAAALVFAGAGAIAAGEFFAVSKVDVLSKYTMIAPGVLAAAGWAFSPWLGPRLSDAMIAVGGVGVFAGLIRMAMKPDATAKTTGVGSMPPAYGQAGVLMNEALRQQAAAMLNPGNWSTGEINRIPSAARSRGPARGAYAL